MTRPSTNRHASPNEVPSDGWVTLRILAEMLFDHQEHRKALANRAQVNHANPAPGVDVDLYRPFIDGLEALEHGLALELRRTYRRVAPAELVAWQKAHRGIGEHLTARLLGVIGDPYIATPHRWEGTGPDRVLVVEPARVRTVSQLWAYCGHGAPVRRRAGMTATEAFALGNLRAKALVWNLATACVKQPAGGRYRDVYDLARVRVIERTHATVCPQCHAQPGDPWRPGHQHAHALRIVGKEILRDMWIARHQVVTGQPDLLRQPKTDPLAGDAPTTPTISTEEAA